MIKPDQDQSRSGLRSINSDQDQSVSGRNPDQGQSESGPILEFRIPFLHKKSLGNGKR